MTCTVRGISLVGRTNSLDVSGVKEFQAIYKVTSDDKRDGPGQARVAFGVPQIGDTYSAGNDFDGSCVVVGKEVNDVDLCEWEVVVTYSNDVPEGDPVGFTYQDNPLAKPAEIGYGFQNRRVLIPGRYNDPLGPPSDNTWQQGIFAPNGELFNPQPEIEISEPILTIKRNVNPLPNLLVLANCVNSDFFQGATPRQLKFNAPQAARQWHKSIGFFWEVSYSLVYRWETWDIQLLNQGTYYFSGGKPTSVWSTTQKRLTKEDVHGNPLIVNLTTNGDINTTATPTFTRLRVLREIPFSSLNLI